MTCRNDCCLCFGNGEIEYNGGLIACPSIAEDEVERLTSLIRGLLDAHHGRVDDAVNVFAELDAEFADEEGGG